MFRSVLLLPEELVELEVVEKTSSSTQLKSKEQETLSSVKEALFSIGPGSNIVNTIYKVHLRYWHCI